MSTNIYQSFKVPVSISNSETGTHVRSVRVYPSKVPSPNASINFELHRLDREYSAAEIDANSTAFVRSFGITITAPPGTTYPIDLTAPNTSVYYEAVLPYGVELVQGARYAFNVQTTHAIEFFAAKVGEESLVTPGNIITSSPLSEGSSFMINNGTIVNDYGSDLMFQIFGAKFGSAGSQNFKLASNTNFQVLELDVKTPTNLWNITNGQTIRPQSVAATTPDLPSIEAIVWTKKSSASLKAIVRATGAAPFSANTTAIIDGGSSQWMATVTSISNTFPYSSLKLMYRGKDFDSTAIDFSYKPSDAAEYQEIDAFVTEHLNELTVGGVAVQPIYSANTAGMETIKVDLSTTNQFVTPVLYTSTNDLRATIGAALIPVATGSDYDFRAEILDTNEATARYLSKVIQLAEGQEAEDLVVLSTASIPPSSDVKAFARWRSPTDASPIETRPWSPMTLDSNRPSSFDGVKREYRWNLPVSNSELDEPEVCQAQIIGRIVSPGNAIVVDGANTLGLAIATHGIGVGDIATFHNTTDNVEVSLNQVKIVSIDLANRKIVFDQSLETGATVTATDDYVIATISVVDSSKNRPGFVDAGDDNADPEIDFSGSARYKKNFNAPSSYEGTLLGEETHYGISEFQFKLVMVNTDEASINSYPILHDVRAIALQS